MSIQSGVPIGLRVDAWEALCRKLAKAKADEMAMRLALFAELIPSPREGANSAMLPDGRVFAATHKLNYTLDAEQLPNAEKKLGKALAKKLIRRKPELVIKEYRALTDEQRLILSEALTVKPGAPDVEIRVPKKGG